MNEIPEDIFQAACGIVMEAKSLKSMLRHKDVVDAIASALFTERKRSFNAGWNMAGGDYRQQDAFKQFNGITA